MKDIKMLYETNSDFKRYVDGCMRVDYEGRTLDEVLSMVITREVADMYANCGISKEEKSGYQPMGECV